MENNQDIQDLDRRLRRVENIHIWGAGIIVVGLLIFFLTKKSSGSASVMASGGGVGDAVSGGVSGSGVPSSNIPS